MRLVVLGGGISGLSLAYYLKQHHPTNDITILERSTRPGGWLHTIVDNNFLFELGPRSCRPKGTGHITVALARELGLEGQMIGAAKAAHRRFLYYKGKLRPLSLLRAPRLLHTLTALWREQRRPCGAGDESIHAFFSRRISPAVAELYIDPIASGIYAGDTHQLSMSACFPRLHHWEQQYGSILKGLWRNRKQNSRGFERTALFSFRRGMETLPLALANQLEAELHTSATVTQLIPHGDHVTIKFQDGATLDADHLFTTISARHLAPLLSDAHPTFCATLADLTYASLAVVSLGYEGKLLPKQGFGYLIPSSEKEKILGVVWDSDVFPQQNRGAQTRLTVMLGGTRQAELTQCSKDELLQIAQEALERHLGLTALPSVARVTLARDAIPQYTLGHHLRLAALEEQLEQMPITLLGNSYYGISVNDCIAHAQRIASRFNQSAN